MRARIIRTDGTTEQIELPEDNRPHGAIREAIGCNDVDSIQVVRRAPGRPGLEMWVDYDGVLVEQPIRNEPAIAILATLWNADPEGVMVVGNVIFTGSADSEGDTMPLTRVQDEVLAEMARKHANVRPMARAA